MMLTYSEIKFYFYLSAMQFGYMYATDTAWYWLLLIGVWGLGTVLLKTVVEDALDTKLK